MMRFPFRLAALAATACAMLQLFACSGGSGGSTAPLSSPSSGPPASQLWILQGPGLEAQAMATSPEGITFFSNPAIRVMYPVVANVPAPAAWNTVLWHKYASFAQFASDIQTGSVPAGTKIVGYDIEAWTFTPLNEQADPIGYTISFATLAHQHGYQVVAMPSENLMQALFPTQDKFAAFITYGMAKAVAPNVDYYSIQSQDLETSPAAYAAYTQTIAAQIHAANAGVVITGGLSTNVPALTQISSANIDAAIASSTSLVSGYWLNVVGATTPIATRALAHIP